MCLDHERLMIEVQCQLMICRRYIGASKGAFQISIVDCSMIKLMSFFDILTFDSLLKLPQPITGLFSPTKSMVARGNQW